MNRKILMICILGVLLASGFTVGTQTFSTTNERSIHSGTFQAELGLRTNDAAFVLDGSFRDFRGRHLLFGTISPVDSERTLRFQGISSRNLFIIQTTVRNNIVNIIGRFNQYDEDMNEYSGNWRGFVVGMGRTSGWITARFSI